MFILKEVTGQKRTLRLSGRGMPFRPFKTRVRQRNDRTMLAGYTQATLTLLGAEDPPIEAQGKWSDKYLGSSAAAVESGNFIERSFGAVDNAIGAVGGVAGLGSAGLPAGTNETAPVEFAGQRVETVREASSIIDTWVRTGQLLEVSWDTLAWYGIIEEFEMDWFNQHDLGWTMHFSWQGRVEPSTPAVLAEELSVGDTVSLFQKLADALGTEALPPTFPMASDVFRDIDQGIKRIADTTQRIADTITNVSNLILAPTAAVRQIVALSNTLKGQCGALIDTLEYQLVQGGQMYTSTPMDASQAALTSSTPSQTLAITSASFTERAVATEYSRRVAEVAKQLRREAVRKMREFSEQLEKDILDVFTARQGQDLRTISQLAYGTPHEWRRIMLFNHLDSPELEPGQTLLIPRVTAMEDC